MKRLLPILIAYPLLLGALSVWRWNARSTPAPAPAQSAASTVPKTSPAPVLARAAAVPVSPAPFNRRLAQTGWKGGI